MEHVLAMITGQNHHVAFVSTSGSVSGLTTEANGVPVAASVPSSSAHANSNFIDTMSVVSVSENYKIQASNHLLITCDNNVQGLFQELEWFDHKQH
ncbi:hypothetical protein CFP56_004156 [Quercus suber]|uniref:AT-hook motif nuclear-localized protein n=1 Tax=Quercus suber TaxID=58331 RepID=A0AAW0LCN7_QUESU